MLVKLCQLDDLPDGGSKGFDPLSRGQDTVFVIRQDSVLRCFVNSCPHWPGSPMAWRKDAYLTTDRMHIACAGHGARFDINAGLCVSGPCLGQSLQALELQVDAAGGVLVNLSAITL